MDVPKTRPGPEVSESDAESRRRLLPTPGSLQTDPDSLEVEVHSTVALLSRIK